MTTVPTTVSGYGNGWGQVWAYDPRPRRCTWSTSRPAADVLDFPDNVTTSARGTLVLCEDDDDFNYLRGLTRKGELFDIAQNAVGSGAAPVTDEFAGATFSPATRSS